MVSDVTSWEAGLNLLLRCSSVSSAAMGKHRVYRAVGHLRPCTNVCAGSQARLAGQWIMSGEKLMVDANSLQTMCKAAVHVELGPAHAGATCATFALDPLQYLPEAVHCHRAARALMLMAGMQRE
ncbi:unnamed protein product [Ostreobium quekettii]|uniref:Uncharacterized protein n=1 Tax=Ostreobium quekettii TaxID=121088 RepID=A0A8S1IQT5_9CHLO|nr:unnamed protein product [Ostreobium quekettii]